MAQLSINLIAMVILSPLSRVVGPFPNGRTSWLINGGDPNHILLPFFMGIKGTPPKATPPINKALLRDYSGE